MGSLRRLVRASHVGALAWVVSGASPVALALLGTLAAPLLAGCEVLDSLDGYAGGKTADAGQGAPDAPGPRPDSGPLGCDSNTKSCAGACVVLTDPAYGCGPSTCDPCAFANATAAGCSPAGACLLGPCLTGYADR